MLRGNPVMKRLWKSNKKMIKRVKAKYKEARDPSRFYLK